MLKKIATTALIGFIAFANVFATPAITAFADDKKDSESTDIFASENTSAKIRLEEVAAALEGANHEDSAKKLRAIIEKLDAIDDDDDKLKSPDQARALIEEVISDSNVLEVTGWDDQYDKSATMFEAEWLNELGAAIEPYGFTMNKYVAVQQYTIDPYTYEEDYTSNWNVQQTTSSIDGVNNTTQNSSKMVQKLRWSQNDSNSKVNITSVLKEYENTFGSVMTLLQSISAALVVAFGASSLLKMSSDRMVSYDAILREFLKLIFGVWFIFNYRYFTILLLRFGTYFTEMFLDGIGTISSESQVASIMRYGLWSSLEQLMQNGKCETYFSGLADAATGVYQITTSTQDSGSAQFGTLICSLFGGIGGTIGGGTLLNIAINWVVFAILIELGIRYTFTPIAIADLYSEGFHSNGMRWLKKMLACALTGALIYLVMYGANVIKTQLTGFHPIQLTAINLTMTGFFVKTRQIADEIVGVR